MIAFRGTRILVRMDHEETRLRRVIGCMSGTSLDGIDAAMVGVRGEGLDLTAEFIAADSTPFSALSPGLPRDLRRLSDQQPLPASRITELMWEFGEAHARVVADLSVRAGFLPDLVCVHGQTVYHGRGRTWQLIQPAPIARAVAAPVVYDLRAADVAAGGGGAPVTPIADWLLFRSRQQSRAVVNLGGFCNVTIIPRDSDAKATWPSDIRGFDVCACNHVLDGLARCRAGRPYDDGGLLAATGAVVPAALEAISDVLRRQSQSARSLGTGDELAAWISATASFPAADVLRTACEAIARQIVHVAEADEIILAGGGVRNRTLQDAITRAAGDPGCQAHPRRDPCVSVLVSDSLGIPATHREAVAFAVLGVLCQDRVPVTLPSVTNCSTPAPVSGAWVFPPGDPAPR